MADQPFPADFDDDFEDDFEDDLEDDFEDDDAWQSDFPEEDDDSDEDGAVFHRNGYARHQIDELLSEREADGAGDPQPTWTLEELLDRLAVDPENVPFAEYFLFSDLTRTQAAYVRSKWHALDVATRRKVLAVLTGALDEFVSLDISALLLAVLDDADSEIRTVAVYTLGDGDAASELLGPLIALVENDP
ncbi:MAG: hypothetical protein KDD75_06360, partial [Caldilineaceae bacterium]|nr:hypothetical protein [Caldilineaceae bacterium]